MHTPLGLWAGMVGEGQVGCPCLYLQELTDRAWAARPGSPARPLDDPARSHSRRDSTGEGLELLAVRNLQGSYRLFCDYLLNLAFQCVDSEGS